MMTHSARAVAHHQLICSHEPAAQTPSNTKGGTERALRHLSYFVNTVESTVYITLWFRAHRPLVKYLMLLLFIQKSRSMTTQQPIEMLVTPSINTEHDYSLYATVYSIYSTMTDTKDRNYQQGKQINVQNIARELPQQLLAPLYRTKQLLVKLLLMVYHYHKAT